eukprot:403344595
MQTENSLINRQETQNQILNPESIFQAQVQEVQQFTNQNAKEGKIQLIQEKENLMVIEKNDNLSFYLESCSYKENVSLLEIGIPQQNLYFEEDELNLDPSTWNSQIQQPIIENHEKISFDELFLTDYELQNFQNAPTHWNSQTICQDKISLKVESKDLDKTSADALRNQAQDVQNLKGIKRDHQSKPLINQDNQACKGNISCNNLVKIDFDSNQEINFPFQIQKQNSLALSQVYGHTQQPQIMMHDMNLENQQLLQLQKMAQDYYVSKNTNANQFLDANQEFQINYAHKQNQLDEINYQANSFSINESRFRKALSQIRIKSGELSLIQKSNMNKYSNSIEILSESNQLTDLALLCENKAQEISHEQQPETQHDLEVGSQQGILKKSKNVKAKKRMDSFDDGQFTFEKELQNEASKKKQSKKPNSIDQNELIIISYSLETTFVPTKKSKCTCKKSQCLKLYCDCFALGGVCGPDCGCLNCENKEQNQESVVLEARKKIIGRNPEAFQPKVVEVGPAQMSQNDADKQHRKGCNCKNSGCQKNYCECFQFGLECNKNCRCIGCSNCLTKESSVSLLKKRCSYKNNLLSLKEHSGIYKRRKSDNL